MQAKAKPNRIGRGIGARDGDLRALIDRRGDLARDQAEIHRGDADAATGCQLGPDAKAAGNAGLGAADLTIGHRGSKARIKARGVKPHHRLCPNRGDLAIKHRCDQSRTIGVQGQRIAAHLPDLTSVGKAVLTSQLIAERGKPLPRKAARRLPCRRAAAACAQTDTALHHRPRRATAARDRHRPAGLQHNPVAHRDHPEIQ